MKTYKYTSPDNTVVHVIDADGISRSSMLASVLPEGATVLPADQPPEPTPLELLAKLDAENALTQRNLREFIQLVTEALKVATNNSVDLSQVPGVAKVYQVENQAVQLRARL